MLTRCVECKGAAAEVCVRKACACTHAGVAGLGTLPAAGSFQDEEEAYYAAELAQREALLGPEHPGLADALSNLAILHNQRRDYAHAQPLYERALRIYERAYGPDNADVAHTLTDLAVLHLEQARLIWIASRGQRACRA